VQLRNIKTLLNRIYRGRFVSIKSKILANVKLICLHLFPRHLYLFSEKGLRLPAPKERIEKTENPLDDWVVVDDGGIDVDSVNIIMRGKSFNLHDFQYSGRVYAVNAMVLKDPKKQKDEIRHYGDSRGLWEFDFPVVYTCGAIENLKEAMEKNLPILYVNRLIPHQNGNFVDVLPEVQKRISEYCSGRSDSHIITMHHKSKCPTIRPGSGLITVVALAKLAKQVNVYGWDFYLEESVKTTTYLQMLALLVNSRVHKYVFLEMGVIHWLYASRLKKLPHVKIQGQLNDVDHHQKIIKNIEKILYR